MIEADQERLRRLARGDPKDPLEAEVKNFNLRIAERRAEAALALKVAIPPRADVDRDDPLGEAVAGFNARVAAARAAAEEKS